MSQKIEDTLGAVLIGGCMCGLLSGVVWMQSLIYFHQYTRDLTRIKALVFIVWCMDSIHTSMVFASNWIYLIDNFGNQDVSNQIPWTIGLTVALTAFITFLVHCFFAHRVFTLSKGNWFVTAPLFALAFLRLGTALVSTTEMIKRDSYSSFTDDVGWVFTVGLSTSCTLEILITGLMVFYLRKARTGFFSMDQVIDSLSLYAIENGLATCLVTVASLICWLSMPRNLIFLGLHVTISKMYSNSLLATLNARKRMRGASEDHQLPLIIPTTGTGIVSPGSTRGRMLSETDTKQLQISVERTMTVQFEDDQEGERPIHRSPTRRYDKAATHIGRAFSREREWSNRRSRRYSTSEVSRP